MKYIIGCDHAGFGMKEAIRTEFKKWGIELEDSGTYNADSVDYPDFASQVASRVAAGDFDGGILICGTGIGMSITANKFKGVRATLCYNTEVSELSRRHNNSNLLVLPGRFVTVSEALKMVRLWLDTPFDGGRHKVRLDKISKIEDMNFHK